MEKKHIIRALKILNLKYPNLPIHKINTSPFRTLITTLLSQRARDDQVIPVAKKLFKHANSPFAMLQIPTYKLQKFIKSAGKYRQNSKRIKQICKILVSKYNGKVPDSEEELLLLPGVGRKTANIVLVRAFGKDTIAVDTHVHRIANRLGWIKTKEPEETEKALQKIVPKKYWRSVNRIFVRHGQTICTPQSPFCSKCLIHKFCKKIRVKRSR